jgi:hypothetical protein
MNSQSTGERWPQRPQWPKGLAPTADERLKNGGTNSWINPPEYSVRCDEKSVTALSEAGLRLSIPSLPGLYHEILSQSSRFVPGDLTGWAISRRMLVCLFYSLPSVGCLHTIPIIPLPPQITR